MTALVIAEHDNASIKGATLNTVAAAAQCGGEVHVLIAGHNAAGAAAAAAQIAGVAKVIHACCRRSRSAAICRYRRTAEVASSRAGASERAVEVVAEIERQLQVVDG